MVFVSLPLCLKDHFIMDNLHFYCALMPCQRHNLEENDTTFLLLKTIIFSDSDIYTLLYAILW